MSDQKKDEKKPETKPDPRKCIVRRAERTAANEESTSHPFNARSQVHGHQLGEAAGLSRCAIWQGRIAPGKESWAYHTHHAEEEWMYVLSGRALVEINDEVHELGPGDFVGFPAPGYAHHVKNPGPDDLVFLSGGERRDLEVADFPRLGKRMVRAGAKVTIYDLTTGEPFPGVPKL